MTHAALVTLVLGAAVFAMAAVVGGTADRLIVTGGFALFAANRHGVVEAYRGNMHACRAVTALARHMRAKTQHANDDPPVD